MAARKALISVVVPALHEDLRELPGHVVRAAGDQPYELVVVDGDPRGSSVNPLEGSASGASLQLLRLDQDSAPNRARQMNLGAARAQGDILLFLHADTMLPPDGLGLVRRCLASGLVAGGAFDLRFDQAGCDLALVAAAARLRTRLTRIPFGDQAPFLTAEAFAALGGFPDIPIMEDVALFRAVRRRGWDVAILPERVTTSARRYRRDGVLRRVLGNWRLQLLFALGANPERLARDYRARETDWQGGER